MELTDEQARMAAAMMRSLEVFAPLSQEQVERLLPFIGYARYEPGEVVIREGEEGDAFYAVYSGTARCEARRGFGGSRELAVLGPGEFFGELALLLKRPRSATVTCETPLECFVLMKSDFERLLERHSDIAEVVRSVARTRYEKGP